MWHDPFKIPGLGIPGIPEALEHQQRMEREAAGARNAANMPPIQLSAEELERLAKKQAEDEAAREHQRQLEAALPGVMAEARRLAAELLSAYPKQATSVQVEVEVRGNFIVSAKRTWAEVGRAWPVGTGSGSVAIGHGERRPIKVAVGIDASGSLCQLRHTGDAPRMSRKMTVIPDGRTIEPTTAEWHDFLRSLRDDVERGGRPNGHVAPRAAPAPVKSVRQLEKASMRRKKAGQAQIEADQLARHLGSDHPRVVALNKKAERFRS